MKNRLLPIIRQDHIYTGSFEDLLLQANAGGPTLEPSHLLTNLFPPTIIGTKGECHFSNSLHYFQRSSTIIAFEKKRGGVEESSQNMRKSSKGSISCYPWSRAKLVSQFFISTSAVLDHNVTFRLPKKQDTNSLT